MALVIKFEPTICSFYHTKIYEKAVQYVFVLPSGFKEPFIYPCLFPAHIKDSVAAP
jgi:hypothetical protein